MSLQLHEILPSHYPTILQPPSRAGASFTVSALLSPHPYTAPPGWGSTTHRVMIYLSCIRVLGCSPLITQCSGLLKTCILHLSSSISQSSVVSLHTAPVTWPTQGHPCSPSPLGTIALTNWALFRDRTTERWSLCPFCSDVLENTWRPHHPIRKCLRCDWCVLQWTMKTREKAYGNAPNE